MASDILIVDDEEDIRELVAGILSDEGHETRTAHDADSALASIADRVPRLVFLDIWLQGSRLDGLAHAHTITLDLHKLGWQPVAAGLLAVRDAADLAALHQRADYLNADDDTEAGLPDLLGRSLRTTRRPDILKTAVTLKTLGRTGLGRLVDHVCALAQEFATTVEAHPRFELHDRPTLSTVLFRPAGAPDSAVAAVRRRLLHDGRAVVGRAVLDGRLWLKATLLNPHARPDDLTALLKLVDRASLAEGHTPA